jgi:hypothetical protein
MDFENFVVKLRSELFEIMSGCYEIFDNLRRSLDYMLRSENKSGSIQLEYRLQVIKLQNSSSIKVDSLVDRLNTLLKTMETGLLENVNSTLKTVHNEKTIGQQAFEDHDEKLKLDIKY